MLISLGRHLHWPHNPHQFNGALNESAQSLSAIGQSLACVFPAPRTGTISHALFSNRTVNGAGTAVIEVRLETVDAGTGLPSGTLVSPNARGLQVVNFDEDENSWLVPLEAGGIVVAGQPIALVARLDQLTGTTTSIALLTLGNGDYRHNGMYPVVNGGPSKGTAGMVGGLRYTGDALLTPVAGLLPIRRLLAMSFHLGSSSNRLAAYFRPPARVLCNGSWLHMADSAGSAYRVRLYAADGTSVLREFMGSDVLSGTTGANVMFCPWDAVELFEYEHYFLSLEALQAGNSITGYYWTAQEPQYLSGTEGGQEFILVQHTSGFWQFDAASQPIMGITIGGIVTDTTARQRQVPFSGGIAA